MAGHSFRSIVNKAGQRTLFLPLDELECSWEMLRGRLKRESASPMKSSLKHGENPHQEGFVVIDEESGDPLAIQHFKTASGKPLSVHAESVGWIYLTNLFRGVDALTRVAAAFERNTEAVPRSCILVQHGNTCGAACGSAENVLHQAIDTNYRASFDSLLVTNVPLTTELAYRLRQWMPADRPFSGIVAPMIEETGAGFFARKKGTCQLLSNPALGEVGVGTLRPFQQVRSIRGATLTQAANTFVPRFPRDWSQNLIEDMCLAWGVCAASDSNCIAAAKDGKLVTNAVGQPCTMGACELAVLQADQPGRGRPSLLKGAAVVSDSFFAFADGIDMLARKKVRAIFATRGSQNDSAIMEHAKRFDVVVHTVPDEEGRIFAGH